MPHPLRSRAILIGLQLVALFATEVTAADSRVSFELVTERGFPLDGTREWSRTFGELENVRFTIRSARGGEQPQLQKTGTADAPAYRVVAVLTRRGRLRLPGSPELSSSDAVKLRQWIDDLRTRGGLRDREAELAFGLDQTALVAFHERLAEPVSFSTKGLRAGDVVRSLVRKLQFEFEVTARARQEFGKSRRVDHELRGLSQGTVLAIVLRGSNLNFAPRRRADGIEIVIAAEEELDEWWPIGWPPAQSLLKLTPSLLKQVPVEIADVSLQTALDAIQTRCELPFLVDQNALRREGILLADHVATFPKRTASYIRVLKVILFSAKLKPDVRTDDGGRPFLWITTLKG